MAPMASSSGLAAVKFWTSSIRVYYQDTTGAIIEAGADVDVAGIKSPDWTAGGPIGARAKLGSPLAAVAWGSGPEIRVFYVNESDILSEYKYSNTTAWVPGNLQSKNIQISPRSLAACMVTDAVIRLYYIAPNPSQSGPIVEMIGDGNGWTTSPAVINTWRILPGHTPLSAVAWRDTTNHVRIYYTDNGMIFPRTAQIQFEESSGWTQSSESPAGNGDLKQHAAITFLNGSTRNISGISRWILSGPNGDDQVASESTSSNSGIGAWTDPKLVSNMAKNASIAAVAWNDAQGKVFRLFFVQGDSNVIGTWLGVGPVGWRWTYTIPQVV